MHPAGWYHAPGDPAHTTRYWDGSAWVGAPTTPQSREHGLGYELIPMAETASSQPAGANAYVGAPIAGASSATSAAAPTRSATVTRVAAKPVSSDPLERFALTGLYLLAFGVLLGIASHNIVTLFPESAETTAVVSDVRVANSRRGGPTVRIELQTSVGTFYDTGRVRNMPNVTQGEQVAIIYSERTGGLVAIPRYGTDRRPVGRFLWPAAGLVALAVGVTRWRYDYRRHRDGLAMLFLVMFLAVGPVLGYLVVTDALDQTLSALFAAP